MDLHRHPFDEGTQAKLALYRDYIREWLPVFVQAERPWVHTVQIFDFFAGPGRDSDGNPGSPLIAIEEMIPHWEAIKRHGISMRLFLNELAPLKYKALQGTVPEMLQTAPALTIAVSNKDFAEAFQTWCGLMDQPGTATLLFLDQNGVKQITPEVFRAITKFPATDFLFFVSSSYVRRFRDHEAFQKYINIPWDEFERRPYCQIHRTVLEWYKSLLPPDQEYYLAPFSIKKGANIYGLIFGSRHVRGIEKFLGRCWALDPARGEANFDIDGDRIDPAQSSLFREMDIPKKLQCFEHDLRETILSGACKTNIDVYRLALEAGCLPRHAKEICQRMQKEGLIREGAMHISYDAWKKRLRETEPIEML